MISATASSPSSLSIIAEKAIQALNGVSWSILAVPMRLAAFAVFWRAGTSKLDSWETTVLLFREEYQVPLLPPEIAATLATSVEIGAAVAILLGFLTRLSALALLGLTAVIQIFVYPESWPAHVQWLAFLLPLLARGAGAVSLDHLVARYLPR